MNRQVGAFATDVRLVWFTYGVFDDYWVFRGHLNRAAGMAHVNKVTHGIDPRQVAIYELPRDCVEMCELEELGETRRACEQMQADEECPF